MATCTEAQSHHEWESRLATSIITWRHPYYVIDVAQELHVASFHLGQQNQQEGVLTSRRHAE